MGVVEGDREGEHVYGLVFQHGDEEVSGIKLQQIECSKEHWRVFFEMNSARLALALREYRSRGFEGTIVVGVYARMKKNDLVEPGIAVFPAPSADGPESRGPAELKHVDAELGRGSSRMALAIGEAIAHVKDDSLIPFRPIDLDVRTRLEMEQLRLDFLVHGQKIYCLRTALTQQDPLWDYAARGGLRELLHLPSVPAARPVL
jgi:hypothetical protein